MTLAVAAAFEAAFHRKPTAEEVGRLERVMDVLDVRENDAIMTLMVVLEFYLGLYSSVPGRIEAAAKAAVGETKETTEKIAATAAQLAHGDLVEQLRGEDFGHALLIPRAMLKADEELFLDGMRKSEAEEALGTRIIPVASGEDLVEIIFSE